MYGRGIKMESITIKIGGMTINSCNISQINICSGKSKMNIQYDSGTTSHGDYVQEKKCKYIKRRKKNSNK